MRILIGVFCAAIYTDWRYYRIPNLCILLGMAAGLIQTAVSCTWGDLICALGAAAVLFLAFYPFYLLGALGAGDVKLAVIMGMYLTGDYVVGAVFYGCILSAVFSILMLARGKMTRKDSIPFVPFRYVGVVIRYFIG